MLGDRTLANAPLLEVIAEIHWSFPAPSMGHSHDPNWFRFAGEVVPALASRLPAVEELQPAGTMIPLDVLGRSPILRLRPKPGAWPLAQLGQGMLTVNAVPPYDGWEAVKSLLTYVLESIKAASPWMASVAPERFQLTYRDGFTASHGVADPARFFVDEVPLVSRQALESLASVGSGMPAPGVCEIHIPLARPSGATASIRGSYGKVVNPVPETPAAIMDFVVVGKPRIGNLETSTVMNWFDDAHQIAWDMFNRMIPAPIMSHLKGRANG